MRKQKGFSLIELLIVVAIILIIAAIAIPNLMRSRIQANEASAVGSIKAITNAQIIYSSTYPEIGFASSMANLGPPSSGNPSSANANLLDNVLGCSSNSCTKAGYTFSLGNTIGTPVADYLAVGTPITYQSSGVNVYCSIADGAVRKKDNGSSTPPSDRAACVAYSALQ